MNQKNNLSWKNVKLVLHFVAFFMVMSVAASSHPITATLMMTSCLAYVLYRYIQLEEVASVALDDIDELIGNSQGVAGLHMNGEVAEWESLLEGGCFGAWLESLEELRNVLKFRLNWRN